MKRVLILMVAFIFVASVAFAGEHLHSRAGRLSCALLRIERRVTRPEGLAVGVRPLVCGVGCFQPS